MLKTLLGLVFNLQKEVRKEADYIAQTIGDGIRKGFEDGFNSVRSDLSRLMISVSSIIFGILFVSYGLATLLEASLRIPGIGFLIMGLMVLILGIFTSMKR